MPLEIRELIVKATVDNNGGNASATSVASNSGDAGQEQIIDRCVEKVLEILKEKSER